MERSGFRRICGRRCVAGSPLGKSSSIGTRPAKPSRDPQLCLSTTRFREIYQTRYVLGRDFAVDQSCAKLLEYSKSLYIQILRSVNYLLERNIEHDVYRRVTCFSFDLTIRLIVDMAKSKELIVEKRSSIIIENVIKIPMC